MHKVLRLILQTRFRATLTALASFAVPLPLFWVGLALIALVALRINSVEAILLGLLSFLPAVLNYLWRHEIIALLCIPWVLLCAVLLKKSNSWNTVLFGNMIAAIVCVGLLLSFGNAYLDWTLQQLQVLLLQISERVVDAQQTRTTQTAVTREQIAFLLAGLCSCVVLGCLLIARFWQFLLDAPGNFAKEIKNFKLTPLFAVGCSLALVMTINSELSEWQMLLTVPLIFSGLALIHWLAEQQKWPQLVFFVLYPSLILPPVILFIMAMALTDSLIDIRKHISNSTIDKV